MSDVVSLLRSAPAPDGEAAKEATKDASFALSELIPAGIILGVAIVVALFARYLVERVLMSSRNEIIARLIARTVATIAVLVGLVYSLSSLGIQVGLLLGALGIGGIALAFALQDTLENFISGIILQIQRPFDYNDIVEIGDYAGKVDDISLRAVTMTVFSGEKVVIPSKDVLQNPIENWTGRPTRRIEIEVGVHYDSDVHEACQVVTDALRDVDRALNDPAPATVFSGFGDSSINLTAHVWFSSKSGSFFDVRRDAAARIKRALARADIGIPFPTRTVLVSDDAGGGDVETAPHREGSISASADGPDPDAGDGSDAEQRESVSEAAE